MLNFTKNNDTKSINILFIITLFNKMGGAEKNLHDIIQNIDKNKFTPHLVAFQGGELSEKIKQNGISTRVNNLTRIFSLNAIKEGFKLFKYLKKNKIKIIVTYHHDADIWGSIIARLAGVPVVISSRRDMGYQLKKRHIWFYRIFNFLFSSFISVSDAVKESIANREWVNKKKITTIHNGLDPEDFSNTFDKQKIKAELGINPQKTVIGMVASFREIKGQIYLVEAINEIVKEFPNIQIVIIGYKNTAYFQTVMERIQALNLQDFFVITGDRSDVPQLLSIFDIFVISSVNEGFSNAIIEAMAVGKPVIAPNSGGNPEAVLHNKTGFLFTPCDSRSLAKTLCALLNQPELQKKMGIAGQLRVKKHFQFSDMIQKNEEVYQYNLYMPSHKVKAYCWWQILKNYYLKKIIKISLCSVLYYSGFLLFLKTFIKKKSITVLAYHSIDKIKLRPLEMEQEPDNFRQQMEFLRKNYDILSLSEFLEFKKKNVEPPNHSVLITFDDGYRDNFFNAYPILKELNIPAVIFIAPQFIDNKHIFYFDMLRQVIQKKNIRFIDLSEFKLGKYSLWDNEYYLSQVIIYLTNLFKPLSAEKQQDLVERIASKLKITIQSLKDKNSYLFWDEIEEMARNNINFGSHSYSHAMLSALSPKDCRGELMQSNNIINKKLNKKTKSLAYPFGSLKDFDDQAKKIAKESGYEVAFILGASKNNSDLFVTGRLMVDTATTTNLSGALCKQIFMTVQLGLMK